MSAVTTPSEGCDLTQTPRTRSLRVRCAEVVRLFGPFGFIAFGGTAVNIVMVRKIFVVREKWVDEKTFADLFALGSALPGPSFSQLAFSVALLRGGYVPALLSFVLLNGPGALAMLGLGFAVRHIPPILPDVVFACFSGLNAAAVGLITLAAYDLSAKVITDPLTRIEVLLSAAVATCYESQWLFPALMAVGGMATLVFDLLVEWRAKRIRKQQLAWVSNNIPPTGSPSLEAGTLPSIQTGGDIETAGPLSRSVPVAQPGIESSDIDKDSVMGPTSDAHTDSSTRPLRQSISSLATAPTPQVQSGTGEPLFGSYPYFSLSVCGGLIISTLFILFLIVVLILRGTFPTPRAFDFFVNLLVAGTIIFGGGPVVIPLLRSYTVDHGWVNPRDFLLGFAVLQAIPGPLFNFAVFLGVLTLPAQPFLGGLLGFVAIFMPGIVLKVGLLPLYSKWRSNKTTRSVLRGLNATAVGLIFAATYQLFRVGFVTRGPDISTPAVYSSLDQDGWWVVITATTFVTCEWFDVPAPVAIVAGAVGGIGWWGVKRQ